jgi:glycosyltransferase involved in cell wall biosynthesis
MTCLAALESQTLPAHSFEVIVIDDGSEDDTVERLNIFRPAHFGLQCISQENSGPAAARNAGIRAASAPIVIFIDDDCRPHPAWAEGLVECLETSDPSVAGCGGLTVRLQDGLVSRYVDRIGVLCPQVDRGKVLYVITCNAAFRRSALTAVGGFCEDFTQAGGEDPDLCMRIAELGFTFAVQDQSIVMHSHPASLTGLFRMYARYGNGLVVTFSLGRTMPAVPAPYPGHIFLRHFSWPDTSLAESLGYFVCETVKNAGLISAFVKARCCKIIAWFNRNS